jgi:cytochrome c
LTRCHCAGAQGGKNGQGPNLWGIIGRTSGSVDGFAYSAANKNSGIVWSDKHLEVYLQDPKKVGLLHAANSLLQNCGYHEVS